MLRLPGFTAVDAHELAERIRIDISSLNPPDTPLDSPALTARLAVAAWDERPVRFDMLMSALMDACALWSPRLVVTEEGPLGPEDRPARQHRPNSVSLVDQDSLGAG